MTDTDIQPAPMSVTAVKDPGRMSVERLQVRYGHVVALQEVTFELEPGAVLAVLGPNGAGKSSLANALSGLVTAAIGTIALDGEDVSHLASYRRARLGLGHLPDKRAIFPSLSVDENLRMFFQSNARRQQIDRAYELFPNLARRKRIIARRLSGGEQQILALSRLLVSPPRVLIVDELSHGLAPGIVAGLFDSLAKLKGECSMIIIEQFVSRAVELADAVLVLSHGEVEHYGSAAEFTSTMAEELYGLAIGGNVEHSPPSSPG